MVSRFKVIVISVLILMKTSDCPHKSEDPPSCSWLKEDKNDPRDSFKPGFEYRVTVTAKNRLGNASTTATFNTIDIVKPDPVSNLTSIAINSSTVHLHWNTIHSTYSLQLVYRVKAVIKGSTNVTLVQNGTVPENGPSSIVVVVSLQPYSLYEFTVQVKPLRSGFWSDEMVTEIRTLEGVPESGPFLSGSSFTTAQGDSVNRKVFIYWQPLGMLLSHGPITRYHVTVIEAGSSNVITQTETGNEAEIELGGDQAYQVKITSENLAGNSSQVSELFLPRQSEVLKGLRSVAAERNVTHVRVWWKLEDTALLGRTILHYCKGEVTKPSTAVAKCQGTYHWITVNQSETSHVLELDDPQQFVFGVSIDTDTSTSGIVWSECLFQTDSVPSKVLEVIAYDRSDTDIDLRWKSFTCGLSASGRVNSYEISCSVVEPDTEISCYNAGSQSVIHGDWESNRGRVDGLQASTKYLVCVRAVAPSGPGPWSDPLTVSTKVDLALVVGYSLAAVLAMILILIVLCIWRKINSPMDVTLPDQVSTYEYVSTTDRSRRKVENNPENENGIFATGQSAEVFLRNNSNGSVCNGHLKHPGNRRNRKWGKLESENKTEPLELTEMHSEGIIPINTGKKSLSAKGNVAIASVDCTIQNTNQTTPDILSNGVRAPSSGQYKGCSNSAKSQTSSNVEEYIKVGCKENGSKELLPPGIVDVTATRNEGIVGKSHVRVAEEKRLDTSDCLEEVRFNESTVVGIECDSVECGSVSSSSSPSLSGYFKRNTIGELTYHVNEDSESEIRNNSFDV